jgi:hypothetical protein
VGEQRRQRGHRALEEARRRLDAGDVGGAAAPLERARADFAAELDLEGVREVRAQAERGYREAAEADDPFYEQLLYASAQNVRFLSRRDAARRGVEWVDPHPELDQPGRPEMRVERGVSRSARRWLVGVSLAVLLTAGGTAAGIALSLDRATVVNDTAQPVGYVDCGQGGLDINPPTLLPHTRKRFTGWNLCFAVYDPNGHRLGCLRLHDGETISVRDAKNCV